MPPFIKMNTGEKKVDGLSPLYCNLLEEIFPERLYLKGISYLPFRRYFLFTLGLLK